VTLSCQQLLGKSWITCKRDLLRNFIKFHSLILKKLVTKCCEMVLNTCLAHPGPFIELK